MLCRLSLSLYKMKTSRKLFPIILFTILLIPTSCGALIKSQKNKSAKIENRKVGFPERIGLVNDFENILTQEEEIELSTLIREIKALTSDQIFIVTLSNIEPYEHIDGYSLDLANYWELGEKNKNNGILIAIGKTMRKIRIQNGFGIEERLTDLETKKIIDEIMIPEFKQDHYFEGLKNGLESIRKELNKYLFYNKREVGS